MDSPQHIVLGLAVGKQCKEVPGDETKSILFKSITMKVHYLYVSIQLKNISFKSDYTIQFEKL